MARAIVALTADVWTDVGTGALVLTIAQEGEGKLFLNNSQAEASAFEIFPRGSAGRQFANNVALSTTSCKSTGAGWSVAVDAS